MSGENRPDTPGTDIEKNKHRISTMLAINGDGNHMLPVSYNGKFDSPICTQGLMILLSEKRYRSQSHSWMDIVGFNL